MRGHPKELKIITLTGNVYLQNIDQVKSPQKGDVTLCLNDEKELFTIILNEYRCQGFKGYFKAKVFDGRDWRFLDNNDFFADRINQFSKTDYAISVYEPCRERVMEFKGKKFYRTYREHYSLLEEQEERFNK